jgi:alpha-beta hydrolase superfamily lysophospholipase
MRFFAFVVLATILADCTSAADPDDAFPRAKLAAVGPMSSFSSPQLAADRMIAADGATLPLRSWLPQRPPRAVVLALHGFNDYSNAFAGAGATWAKNGIATYAYDQRGFGAAPGRGHWPGIRRLAGDAETAAKLLRQRYPGVPLYLLGESMGGAVAILAASGRSGAARPDVDGVILVAPAVWGRQTMNVAERIGLWLANLMPAVQFSPDLIPVRIRPSDNVPMLRAFSADPLVIKDTRADTLKGLVDLMSAALSGAAWFDAPALLLYGDHDEIVPRVPMARFVDGLPARAQVRQRIALYPRGYHMLLRDLDGPLPIEDITAWIADPAAPLPSGADGGARTRLTGHSEPLAAANR